MNGSVFVVVNYKGVSADVHNVAMENDVRTKLRNLACDVKTV
jgi:hypothetical protein